MKHLTFIIFLLFFIAQSSHSQKQPPIGYYKDFYLGMPEEEFKENFKDKYNATLGTINKGVFAGLSYDKKKHDFSFKTSRFKIPDNKIGKSQVVYDWFELTFVNKLLYKIEIWKDEKAISKKESEDVLNYFSTHHRSNKCKAFFDSRPDKKAKIFKGSRTYSSMPKLNGKLSPFGNSIWVSYQIKDKHRLFRPNRIIIKDNSTEFYWKEFMKMTNEFDKKGYKAYHSFRGVSIGMSLETVKEKLEKNIQLASDSAVAKAYKDSKHKDVYLKYDTYYDNKPSPLMGIPLKEVDYFFYENKLAIIRCLFNEKTDLQKFEKGLVQVYGKADKIYKDGGSMRVHKVKSERFNKDFYEFCLLLSKGIKDKPSELLYRENFAFNNLIQKVKDEKKKKLKDDF